MLTNGNIDQDTKSRGPRNIRVVESKLAPYFPSIENRQAHAPSRPGAPIDKETRAADTRGLGASAARQHSIETDA
jgi:hypothetical protein